MQLSELTSQDFLVSEALKQALVQQAMVLAAQYDAVVANPPYMGSKGMNPLVKKFAKDEFPDAKADLFACFIERGFTLASHSDGDDAELDVLVVLQGDAGSTCFVRRPSALWRILDRGPLRASRARSFKLLRR